MDDSEEGVKFIVDETLDFSGLSPYDSREEEDIAVFATPPEKPFRRGLSHRSDLNAVAPAAPPSLRLSLGRLSPEKLEEILDEANRLAAQLEQCALQERETASEGPAPRRVKPSPRRETFVLKDSPVRDLLPTVSSLTRSTPSPSSLTPRLRGSDRKGPVRALRTTSGKKPASTKRESPTCHLFPTSKSPASSPVARSTPPIRSSPVRSVPLVRSSPVQSSPLVRSAPLVRSSPVHSPPPVRPSNPVRSSPPMRSTPPVRGKGGPHTRTNASPPIPVRPVLAPQPPTSNSQRSSRPPGAVAKPSSRLPVPSAIPRPASRNPLPSRSAVPSKGTLPPETLLTRKGPPRASTVGHRVPLSQRPSLSVPGGPRSRLQPPRKAAVPGPTR